MRATEVGGEWGARVQGSIPPRAIDGRHRSHAHDIGVTSAGWKSKVWCLWIMGSALCEAGGTGTRQWMG